MMKRHEIYERAKDHNVATVVVYADASTVLFYDEDHTNPVLIPELKDLFLKGMTIVNATGGMFVPLVCPPDLSMIICADGQSFIGTEPVEE